MLARWVLQHFYAVAVHKGGLGLVKLIQCVDAHEKTITAYIIEKPQGKLLPGVRFDRSR